MNEDSSNQTPKWRGSRYGFAVFFLLSLPAVWLVLRLVLFLQFEPERHVPSGEVLRTFFSGFHRDGYVALWVSVPLLFWFLIVPDRWFVKRGHRVLLGFGFFLFWLGQIFLLMTEYFFFEEFRSRFNTVAVDYLLYPTEVFINIWDSYPVVAVLVACGVVSLVWLVIAFRLFGRALAQPCPPRTRWLCFLGALLLVAALTPTVSLKPATVSAERTLNEIANNGALSFAGAFWTRNLDYTAYYKTLPRDEAYARVRKLLAEPKAEFVGDRYSIRRRVAGDPNRPRLNVVIFLEESLGSEFWGSLGRKGPTLTPEMDRLAKEEGLLFTNLYASGNRTVRGFEGVLSGFPPLPGDSIVKRDQSENVETIARILKRDGYQTVFFYGGRAVFDGMGTYALNNGWDRFLEHNPPFQGSLIHTVGAGFLSLFAGKQNAAYHDDFPNATFSTIWGVCDEDVFTKAVGEFRKLNDTGKPFLGTILSVSNHKPYTYPPGRIPDDPNDRKRENAVKYADWCLGQFFQAAKKEAFWTNTVFVVVADHGARVFGSQDIPIFSYEIPLLIAGPAVVKQPARVPRLGCSLDVSPTILGLIGRPYETLFFGCDLLNDPPEQNRALLNHNRDVGMYARERLVTLGLMKKATCYEGDPKVVDLKPMKSPAAPEEEFEKDCIAIYQVADELYTRRQYRLDP